MAATCPRSVLREREAEAARAPDDVALREVVALDVRRPDQGLARSTEDCVLGDEGVTRRLVAVVRPALRAGAVVLDRGPVVDRAREVLGDDLGVRGEAVRREVRDHVSRERMSRAKMSALSRSRLPTW